MLAGLGTASTLRKRSEPSSPPRLCPTWSGDPLQEQQRDLTIRRVKETEKELSRQLRQQKEHYEATIQRHLSFIDQVTQLWEAMWGERTWSADPGLVSLSRDWSVMLTAGPLWLRPQRGSPAGLLEVPWGGIKSLTPPPSQLIEDKKILSEKCEAVVAELKQGDQRCRERVAQMQEQHELVSPLADARL